MKRVISLDVLRGITIAGMIIVNNPAVWGVQYAPLKHAEWNGLTPTDLVFPFFLFIMGVSAYFSLSKRLADGLRPTILHVLKRSVLIFATGLLLHLFSRLVGGTISDWSGVRFMGVLQALALTYLLGSVVLLVSKFRHMLTISISILVGYGALLLLGGGYEISPDNIIAVIDRSILGESHMYTQSLPEGGRMAFDPEGLVSTLPKISHFIIGAFVGRMIKNSSSDNYETLSKIFLLGAVCLISGYLLQYGLPINKKVWSPTYTLVSCGYASLTLAVLMWAIDIRGWQGWTTFFRVFGSNPLFLYCIAWILSVLLGIRVETAAGTMSLKRLFFAECLSPVFGDAFGSLIYSLLLAGVVWLVGYPLYKKKIYIKL
ncbi:MAG: acyltransferase family protein [Candidatus Cryptobacteroides sp.]